MKHEARHRYLATRMLILDGTYTDISRAPSTSVIELVQNCSTKSGRGLGFGSEQLGFALFRHKPPSQVDRMSQTVQRIEKAMSIMA